MRTKKLRPWSDNIDPATIPDEVLATERGKRNAAKRKTRSGGLVWGKHNPKVTNCRCQRCIDKRARRAAA